MEEFNKKGFPIIKWFDDHFEVKAIDFWEFRSFNYSDVIKIDYYKNTDDYALWPTTYLLIKYFSPFNLKIVYPNGGDWTYKSPTKYNEEFASVVSEIMKRIEKANSTGDYDSTLKD